MKRIATCVGTRYWYRCEGISDMFKIHVLRMTVLVRCEFFTCAAERCISKREKDTEYAHHGTHDSSTVTKN